MLKLALIFLCLSTVTSHAAMTAIVFQGQGLNILHDGSTTAFNPHRDAGRKLLLLERESCCVESPPNWHGPQSEFNFQASEERALPHDSKHFVINAHTGTFVSTTSLQNPHYPVTDARRYVDSDITPAIALSQEQATKCGCKLGDRAEIIDPKSGAKVWAVYANDAGSKPEGLDYTEISPAAAAALNLILDPESKEPKSRSYHLDIHIYPGSGYGIQFPHGGVAALKDAS